MSKICSLPAFILLIAGFSETSSAASVATADESLIQAVRTVRENPADDRSDIIMRWDSLSSDGQVDIYVASNPEEELSAMEPVATGISAAEGEWRTERFDNLRPYFSITPAGTKKVLAKTAVRLLPLEGGRNFRDLGGYRTEEGKMVKWGHVYRSGVMHELSDDDYDYLTKLGIRIVCDLRSMEERAEEPTQWGAGEAEYISWDYSTGGENSALRELFASGNVTEAEVRQAMIDLYPQLLYSHKDKYSEMFNQLASGNVPLAFNCTAGKDRTGIGAALILSAVGVAREDIVQDYALSDDYVDYETEFVGSTNDEDSPYAFLAQLPKEVLRPLLASDPLYIESALEQIENEYGTVLNFIHQELSVTDEELLAIKSHLVREIP